MVHPQHWPDDLDTTGRRVVVIGSGATAMTLVPALADAGAGQVTMLQRSPTYVLSLPGTDPVAGGCGGGCRSGCPTGCSAGRTSGSPSPASRSAGGGRELAKKVLRDGAAEAAPRGLPGRRPLQAARTTRGTSGCAWCPTATCSARSARARVDIVTDTIDTFTEKGVRVGSGRRAARRRRGDGHRLQPQDHGRRRPRRRRRAGRPARPDGLPRADVQRRAQLRLHASATPTRPGR